MHYLIHKAVQRGTANFGWLRSFHSFSFGSYYNPDNMQFGALRVLNDDWVEPAAGFPKHGHRDMEIVSIPLSGDLKHQDSTGTAAVIRSGDVQVMSAGTGIEHSEFNASSTEPVAFLQIWVIPREKGVQPRYQQLTLPQPFPQDNWIQVVSPNPDDDGVYVHQDAWFSMVRVSNGIPIEYTLKSPESHGVYFFVIEGALEVEGVRLDRRDALGVWDVTKVHLEAKSDSRVLAIEVPMGAN
jgi:redox-sensitive bicupin YhaK (pirin superfamily)